jgi:hypothetical protein
MLYGLTAAVLFGPEGKFANIFTEAGFIAAFGQY